MALKNPTLAVISIASPPPAKFLIIDSSAIIDAPSSLFLDSLDSKSFIQDYYNKLITKVI
jgi:hypothetical protein